MTPKTDVTPIPKGSTTSKPAAAKKATTAKPAAKKSTTPKPTAAKRAPAKSAAKPAAKKAPAKKATTARKATTSRQGAATRAAIAKPTSDTTSSPSPLDACKPFLTKDERAAALDQQKAHKAWVKGGRSGDEPDVALFVRMEAEYAAGRTAAIAEKDPAGTGTTSTRGRAKRPQSVRFSHDGKPMPDSQNKISSVAYYFTKGIDGDAPRISTGALVELLGSLGVTEVETSEWSVTLPNGVVLSAAAL